MPFDTVPNFRTMLKGWMARGDLTDPDIDDCIRLGEFWIQKELKLKTEEAVTSSLTMTAGEAFIELPADYVEGRFILLLTQPQRNIEIVSMDKWSDAQVNASKPGIPLASVQHGTRLLLGPGPNSDHEYDLYYWKGITTITGGTINALFTAYPDLYLYASLVELADFKQDERKLARYAAFREAAKKGAKLQNWRSKTGTGPLRMRPDHGAP